MIKTENSLNVDLTTFYKEAVSIVNEMPKVEFDNMIAKLVESNVYKKGVRVFYNTYTKEFDNKPRAGETTLRIILPLTAGESGYDKESFIKKLSHSNCKMSTSILEKLDGNENSKHKLYENFVSTQPSVGTISFQQLRKDVVCDILGRASSKLLFSEKLYKEFGVELNFNDVLNGKMILNVQRYIIDESESLKNLTYTKSELKKDINEIGVENSITKVINFFALTDSDDSSLIEELSSVRIKKDGLKNSEAEKIINKLSLLLTSTGFSEDFILGTNSPYFLSIINSKIGNAEKNKDFVVFKYDGKLPITNLINTSNKNSHNGFLKQLIGGNNVKNDSSSFLGKKQRGLYVPNDFYNLIIECDAIRDKISAMKIPDEFSYRSYDINTKGVRVPFEGMRDLVIPYNDSVLDVDNSYEQLLILKRDVVAELEVQS